MSIITLILILIIVGVAMYLVNSVIPMDPKVKTILNVVVVLVLLLWVLDAFVDLGSVGRIQIRRS